MENKTILIDNILEKHILTDTYYQTILNVFHKEFNIDLFQTDSYSTEINSYKHGLTVKLTQFMDRIYSYEELSEMSLDSNCPFYYRMLTEEYKGLFANETRIFSADLREKFARDGVSKKTFVQTTWETITSYFS